MQKIKRYRHIMLSVCMAAVLCLTFSQPVFAMTESEIQDQVNTVGRETASGNVLIWFLCAIAFLKVSQKIDSFMSSLGINVGHTGGSMLAETLVAARGIGGLKNFSSQHFGGAHSKVSSHTNADSKGFISGGLAGMVSSRITNSAVKSTTASSQTNVSHSSGKSVGGIGGHIYASSVSKGGNFANNVISTVATGNIAELGFMSGPDASQALQSYLGYAALGENVPQIPTFSDVEIGGERITSTETSEEQAALANAYAQNLSLFLGDGMMQGLAEWDGSSIPSLGDVRFTDGVTEVVYYNQLDERYAGKPYDTDHIGSHGCGPASMAIVVSSLTGQTVDPVDMVEWSYQNGYWCKDSGSYHALIPAAARNWGLDVSGCPASEPQRILDALADGKLVIAIMSKGHFTKSGHFIVLRGVQNGKILVADPASYNRSGQPWDLSLILKEASRGAAAGGPFWIIG